MLAGTSAHGCCADCGAPWRRVVEKGEPDLEHQRACGGNADGGYDGAETKDYDAALAQSPGATKERILAGLRERRTVAWEPTCKCETSDVVPATVLDPFAGSGTTGLVANGLGRDFIGCEINPEYAEIARARIQSSNPLFATVEMK